jgi:hypothetical protein
MKIAEYPRHPQVLLENVGKRAGLSEAEREELREEMFLSLLIMACETQEHTEEVEG